MQPATARDATITTSTLVSFCDGRREVVAGYIMGVADALPVEEQVCVPVAYTRKLVVDRACTVIPKIVDRAPGTGALPAVGLVYGWLKEEFPCK